VLIVWGSFQVGHSKLASYIFPLFPALALLTADFLVDALDSDRNRRLLLGATFGTLLFLVLAPLGYLPFQHKSIVQSLLTPSMELSLKMAYGALILIALGMAINWVLRKNPAVPLLFVIPVILGLAGTQSALLDPFVSSARACKTWMAQYPIQGTILCSKGNARAIHSFTDQKVAIVGVNGSPFFSPIRLCSSLKRHRSLTFFAGNPSRMASF
jgi:hypothetical protein